MRLAVALLPLLAWGCASDPTTTQDFGALAGTDARIAVIADEEAVAVYVCGGPTTLARVTRWFIGPASATHLENGDLALDLVRTATGASGKLSGPSGLVQTFGAERADEGAQAGLFEVIDRGCRAGVIFDPVRGVQGAWCDGEGRFAQVDPGGPASFDPDRIEAQVMRPDGPGTLVLTRVSPAALFMP